MENKIYLALLPGSVDVSVDQKTASSQSIKTPFGMEYVIEKPEASLEA